MNNDFTVDGLNQQIKVEQEFNTAVREKAKYLKKYHNALIEEGFDESEAMNILLVEIPMMWE